jgi:hypothetical protein
MKPKHPAGSSFLANSTIAELHSRYKDYELALILDYMKGALAASTEHVWWFHQLPAPRVRSSRRRSKKP